MQIPGRGGRGANEQREETDSEWRQVLEAEALSHAAQGGRGNTSHRPVSAPRTCQQKGQESSGGNTWDMPGGRWWRQALTPTGTMPTSHRRTHTRLSGSITVIVLSCV